MGKPYGKMVKSFIISLGYILLLTACGPKETVKPSPSPQEVVSFLSGVGVEGLDMAVDSNAFYDVASDLKGPYDDSTSDDGKFLGMQFYQGEPVQLWASAADRTTGTVSIYMYRQDGTRETCLEEIERFSGQRICFRDSEGCYYSINHGTEKDSIVRLDSIGKAQYTVQMDEHIVKNSVCELADGRMAMFIYEGNSVKDFDIALLDAEGKITIIAMSEQLPYSTYIGVSEEGLLLMKNEQLYRVVFPDGKLEQLFSFAQTVYSTRKDISQELNAFCVSQNGKLELLWADWQGSGLCDTLSLVKRDESREEIRLRGIYVKNQSWLKEQILKFNSSNDRYLVVIETPEEEDDTDDYIARTGVELAAGKGPDLLLGPYLIESPESLIEKGSLLDLAPLIEQAGMKEEDYFPLTFGTWRMGDSIYSIKYNSSFSERLMSLAVLGDMRDPDIEAIVDAMLAYPENVVYGDSLSAGRILRELLEGSETLWGMVDWENGACDFSGGLFAKLLEAAKRYKYDARNNYPAICSYSDFSSNYHFYAFQTRADIRAEGYVPVGQLFDDGSHPICSNVSVSVNANGANREGAWEFLKFLLSEEVQGSISGSIDMPVKKSVFWEIAEKEMMNGPSMNYSYRGEIIKDPPTRERVEEIAALLENVRALPFKTEAVLEIVLEEAQEYFDGVKEIPQVVDAIENRVGLYLEERK